MWKIGYASEFFIFFYFMLVRIIIQHGVCLMIRTDSGGWFGNHNFAANLPAQLEFNKKTNIRNKCARRLQRRNSMTHQYKCITWMSFRSWNLNSNLQSPGLDLFLLPVLPLPLWRRFGVGQTNSWEFLTLQAWQLKKILLNLNYPQRVATFTENDVMYFGGK